MKSKRFRKLLPVIQPYSLFNLRETSSSKTETGKQILLYNNFIWPWKHREMVLEQLIQRVKAEEKKIAFRDECYSISYGKNKN